MTKYQKTKREYRNVPGQTVLEDYLSVVTHANSPSNLMHDLNAFKKDKVIKSKSKTEKVRIKEV